MKEIGLCLRTATSNRHIVEKNFSKHITDRNKSLSGLFSKEHVDIQTYKPIPSTKKKEVYFNLVLFIFRINLRHDSISN